MNRYVSDFLVLLIAVLSLSACTSRWTGHDASQFEIWKDQQKCQDSAVQQFPDVALSAATAKQATTEEQRHAARQHAIDSCMNKRGYTARTTPASRS